jgi:hypothetical protein
LDFKIARYIFNLFDYLSILINKSYQKNIIIKDKKMKVMEIKKIKIDIPKEENDRIKIFDVEKHLLNYENIVKYVQKFNIQEIIGYNVVEYEENITIFVEAIIK